MKKLDILLLILLPMLDTVSGLLASKDADDEGIDDEVANAIKFAAERIRKYQAARP